MDKERLEQVRKDIKLLKEEEKRIEQEIKKKEEKRFYIGDSFGKDGCWKLCRVEVAGKGMGVVLINKRGEPKYPAQFNIDIESDGRNYVTKLPTIFPQDFGLDEKYGVIK